MEFIDTPIRSGLVAIVGPPNAGKSTLLNALLGQKVSIVTHKPQTTRNRILGVVNGDGYQIVLLDTPGLHKTDQPLNKEMVRIAMESMQGVDAVLFLLDVSKAVPEKLKNDKEQELAGYMGQMEAPAILVLNKVDLIEKEKLLPLIETYSHLYPFKTVLPLSALHSDGTDQLVTELLALLPMGPRYFPEDIPTDATERFLSGEIIREKIFLLTGQEIPYCSAVLIESFKEDPVKNMVTIHATIVLERPSQKGIVIGKGGKTLKNIGIAARKDIEQMIEKRVMLKLWVKVKKNWSRDEKFLKELGLL
jgi:GTP-binding protein Era